MRIFSKVRTLRNRLKAKSRLRSLSVKSHNVGIRGQKIIFSFDCDTPEDALASVEIVKRLAPHGIPLAFAVPGVRLLADKKSYAWIFQQGCEFLNHGYQEHAVLNPATQEYESASWYHEMTTEAVRADMRAADRAVREVTGDAPSGFRAPHFGCLHGNQPLLDTVFEESLKLGYKYTSTQMPVLALENGPLFEVKKGLVEFPVSGGRKDPTIILDSWNCIGLAKSKEEGQRLYIRELKSIVGFFGKQGLPVLLNFYADPRHLSDCEEFFETLIRFKNEGFEFSLFSSLELTKQVHPK